MSDIRELAKKIEYLALDISRCYVSKSNLNSFLKSLKGLDEREALKKKRDVLGNKSEQEWLSFYDAYILQQLGEIKKLNDSIISALAGKLTTIESKIAKPGLVPTQAPPVKPKPLASGYPALPSHVVPSQKFVSLDRKTRDSYLKQLNLELDYLHGLMPLESSKKKLAQVDYTIYKTSPFGNKSNQFFENYSIRLSKDYPQFFDALSHNLRAADINILSKTYISMMLSSAVLAFFVTLLLALVFINSMIVFRVFLSLFLAVISAVGAFTFLYFYPSVVANSRKRHIKDELPFVVLHMSAIAGSGAQPISMFNLILKSAEYKALEGEIKKIVNYVNLFGYNLTTALRAVSLTTPSSEFRDLLRGLIITIEGGGDLKDFLNSKNDEVMTNYKLERKKYVETLDTYSDVYTGILIAAPLLFFITLAIIRMFGTELMGVSISTIATLGVYGVIPLLNIGFIIFLDMIQPTT